MTIGNALVKNYICAYQENFFAGGGGGKNCFCSEGEGVSEGSETSSVNLLSEFNKFEFSRGSDHPPFLLDPRK